MQRQQEQQPQQQQQEGKGAPELAKVAHGLPDGGGSGGETANRERLGGQLSSKDR